MKVGICTDKTDFFYDIHSLVKSFYPDDEVTIFDQSDTSKNDLPYDLVLPIHIPKYSVRSEAKNKLKRQLYTELEQKTGRTLPWGTLSGIRPTKIPMKLLGEGRTDEEIKTFMEETYFVSDQKIELALEIAKHEQKLLSGYRDGWCLYVDIPFCPSICLYCTFSSSPISAWSTEIDRYLDALEKELTAIRSLQEGQTLHAVYIGGGTPTSLEPENLERLLSMIDRLFETGHLHEYTVEGGRPDSFTKEKLAVLRAHPVSRISVNPQTMNDKTLKLIGRRHTAEDTIRAFYMAREAGFDNINMDLIMGLPEEGIPEVTDTLDEIKKLNPESLTVHSLAVKRASRLNVNKEDYSGLSFHNSQKVMDLCAEAAESMRMHPYYLYRQKNMKGNLENVGCARLGRDGLYNMIIMEETESILAAGAGASTKYVLPDGRIIRVVNPKDVRTYLTHTDELIKKKTNGRI